MADFAAQLHGAATHMASDAQWLASLRLRFSCADERTILSERVHSGPLRLLKPLYPEGDQCCHAVIVHPPGGIVAGDSLMVDVQLDEKAHGLITTPGAQKWYRSLGAKATAVTTLVVDRNAMLEWLPQETIVFDGAVARQSLDIELHENAAFFGWEIVCLGRTARAERYATGQFRQTIRLKRGDALLWSEHTVLNGDDPLLNSVLGWGGLPVSATAWIARPAHTASGGCDTDMLAQLRAVIADNPCAAASNPARGFFVIKVIAASAESARELLATLWSEVRFALFAIAPQRPRIWST